MAQRPLSDEGGTAPILATRVPRKMLDQLDELARRRGIARGVLVRQLVQEALQRSA